MHFNIFVGGRSVNDFVWSATLLLCYAKLYRALLCPGILSCWLCCSVARPLAYSLVQVGTYADVVVADAIVKGVKGFELNTARDALLKDVSRFLSSGGFALLILVALPIGPT